MDNTQPEISFLAHNWGQKVLADLGEDSNRDWTIWK